MEGEITCPCGTPLRMFLPLQNWSLTLVSFYLRVCWFTQSKASDKSRATKLKPVLVKPVGDRICPLMLTLKGAEAISVIFRFQAFI